MQSYYFFVLLALVFNNTLLHTLNGQYMHLIKLSATDSTNAYLKKLMLSEPLPDMTIVLTDNQMKGRGQMGTKWESEPGKNLTFSVLKKLENLRATNNFQLNICISLAIYDALKDIHVPDLKIKWPNDILSGNSKICGILIENILSGNQIQASIIGVGLNVNQLTFNNLKNVSSLKLLLRKTVDLEELLHVIIKNLQYRLKNLESYFSNSLWAEYQNLLFRKDKPSTFKDLQGEMFMGFIKGVSLEGKLVVALEDDVLKKFNMKEIRLLY